jgi:hypothetical protein
VSIPAPTDPEEMPMKLSAICIASLILLQAPFSAAQTTPVAKKVSPQ